MAKTKKPFYLVIIGLSGGGKGTQAKLLAKDFGLVHISVGRLFRREMEEKTALGRKAAKYVLAGQWVPTSLVLAVLTPRMEESLEKGFIIDGFPRLPDQPAVLDKWLEKRRLTLDQVIHLVVSQEAVIARRAKAAKKGRSFYPHQGRKDEDVEAVKERFRSYEETIGPILAYYKRRKILFNVDGERKVKPIYQDIVKRLKTLR